MKLKLAIRGLLKNPFVTIIAICSLALGIGANAAIFSIFHQILLRDLAVVEPDRLVNLSSPGPKQGGTSCGDIGGCESVFSYPMFRDLHRHCSPCLFRREPCIWWADRARPGTRRVGQLLSGAGSATCFGPTAGPDR